MIFTAKYGPNIRNIQKSTRQSIRLSDLEDLRPSYFQETSHDSFARCFDSFGSIKCSAKLWKFRKTCFFLGLKFENFRKFQKMAPPSEKKKSNFFFRFFRFFLFLFGGLDAGGRHCRNFLFPGFWPMNLPKLKSGTFSLWRTLSFSQVR